MRVKRLDVQGFKSFKDKTVIHFDHGITGIVGPNGCGKSNIVDAFFWVMGEQSYKHMRGHGSDDLIFNGSSKYAPLGLAEATLTLEMQVPDVDALPEGASVENTPAPLKTKEMAITRRLYRGGEGEYFINGVQCRLKDIHEFFMDTGVGAKGYSVIEQGQIGKIIVSKPEERRVLIEEAAGIAKYKARKKESLKKIESARANLNELNLVLTEIERNLGSLERQAQKARRYKELHQELVQKETTWARRKVKLLRAQLEVLQSRKSILEQELVGLKAELSTAETSIETRRFSQLDDQKLAEELQSQVEHLAGELTHEQSALSLSRQRQEDLMRQIQQLEHEREEVQSGLEIEREKIVSRQDELESLVVEREASVEARTAAEARAGEIRERVGKAQSDSEKLKRQALDAMARISELQARVASQSARLEAAQERRDAVLLDVETAGARVSEIESELEVARSLVIEKTEAKNTAKQAVESAQATIRENERTLKDKEQVRDRSMRELSVLKSRIQSLEELEAALEGFGEAPKAVMEWAKKSDRAGAFGLLAQAIEIEQGYEPAVEAFLESRLETLLCADVKDALAALDFLREEKRGRTHVRVLTQRPRSMDSGMERMPSLAGVAPGSVRPLRDFIRLTQALPFGVSRGEIEAFVSRLVQGVWVIDDFAFLRSGDSAVLEPGTTLVSAEGYVLDAEGWVRGGSSESEKVGSLLGRKRAIQEARGELQGVETAFEVAELALTTAKDEIEAARVQLRDQQTRVQQLEVDAAGAEKDVKTLERQFQELNGQKQRIESEKSNLSAQVEKLEQDLEDARSEGVELQINKTALDEQVAAFGEDLATQDADLRTAEAQLQELRIRDASLSERLSGLKREIEAASEFAKNRERRLEEIVRLLSRAQDERTDKFGSDSEMEGRILELTTELSAQRTQLTEVRDRLERASNELNGDLDRIKQLHKASEEKSQESNQVAVDVEKFSGELNHILQNVEEKYGSGCLERTDAVHDQTEMEAPVVTEDISAEEEKVLHEEVEHLRDKIRRLGEVNPEAVEQYETERVRHDGLAAEKGDLEQSILNLEEAIQRINKTSEERFRKTFEAIAERYSKLCPIMFGGGRAQLSLVYPEGSTDILEAGVDILAQPPGKTILNITALSGGEKAMAAMALIFAIFMVKPSPFCVLDEVDAPLDDLNIGKFNVVLQEMAEKSQFIVITHNKKTMELNDALYGVTMEEPGVSKVTSIELRKERRLGSATTEPAATTVTE